MSWLFVFGGLCFLIILHEAGHFFAAKATGMRVERFFLFFGPTIWSFKRGETEYGIKAIPLGGYVKITGMNPEEEIPPEAEDRAYYRQPVWKRIVVIGAGPAVNIALAFVILFFVSLVSAVAGDQTVGEMLPRTPAPGVLKPGDRLVAIDGKSYPGLERRRAARPVSASRSARTDAPASRSRAAWPRTPVRADDRTRRADPRTISVRPEYDKAAGRALVGFGFGSTPIDVSAGEGGRPGLGLDLARDPRNADPLRPHLRIEGKRKEISGIVGVSDVGHQTVDVGAAAAITASSP